MSEGEASMAIGLVAFVVLVVCLGGYWFLGRLDDEYYAEQRQRRAEEAAMGPAFSCTRCGTRTRKAQCPRCNHTTLVREREARR